MAKYTDKELKEKAIEFLCAYNLSDPRTDMAISFLSQITQQPPQRILFEINRMADKND